MATFTIMFAAKIKQFHEPWNYDARDVHVFFLFFLVFKNLKASFSVDYVPVCLFDLILYVTSTILQLYRDRSS